MEAIQIYDYEGHEIEFDLGNDNIMVNATEMAKLFGREIKDFMRNDRTKSFIESCLKTEISPFLGVEKQSDLFVSKQRTGTWMHRVLALKFAAWLDSDFEVWVFITIDKILNTSRKILRQQAELDTKIARMKASKYESDPEYRALVELEEEAKGLKQNRIKVNRRQYSAFRESYE